MFLFVAGAGGKIIKTTSLFLLTLSAREILNVSVLAQWIFYDENKVVAYQKCEVLFVSYVWISVIKHP
ncbi:hypothetical protein L4D77_08010 [Photobacterium frigidiphilum]|uniref:hypothetical protein n=1 Tax=Photobacterium frigidiphilum TaxID=264736 RepID=UPI003D0FC21D